MGGVGVVDRLWGIVCWKFGVWRRFIIERVLRRSVDVVKWDVYRLDQGVDKRLAEQNHKIENCESQLVIR